MSHRKSYTAEFKLQAIRLAADLGNVSAAARDLGIAESLLHKWKKGADEQPANPFPGKGNAHDPELAQLKRDKQRLEEEVAILKKAVGIFTSRPQ